MEIWIHTYRKFDVKKVKYAEKVSETYLEISQNKNYLIAGYHFSNF